MNRPFFPTVTSLKSAGSANVPLRGGLRNLRVERLEWPGWPGWPGRRESAGIR